MGAGRRSFTWGVALTCALLACAPGSSPGRDGLPGGEGGGAPGGEPSPPGPLDVRARERRWQPGFHQALRWSVEAPLTTYRIRLPIGRAGDRLRLAFRAGDGPVRLVAATVARAGTGGELASEPVAVTFGGEPGFRAGARARVVSDPVGFRVSFLEELYVSFTAEGHLAASAIDLFPDSWAVSGAAADHRVVNAVPQQKATGLASILVHGPASRSFLAIGDSITEAFVSGRDDYRSSWPEIVERETGLPVANAAVSGQGVLEAHEALDQEVFVLENVSDCLVMIGTNNLLTRDEVEMAGHLQRLFDDLAPFCAVWAGTLPPKDRPEIDWEVRRRRRAINDWIRGGAEVEGVIDFEAVLRVPGDPDRWLPGLAEDGIHPSVAGQEAMGLEAARAVRGPRLPLR